MSVLQETHLEAHQNLLSGECCAQRSPSQEFTQNPIDQMIEQTLNWDTKTKGGIVGFSLKIGAIPWWMVTAIERAAITKQCRELAGLTLIRLLYT
jgi:hypothetical protein